ncbi:hypothetical protein J7E70_30290 [Variovorax paradoxus]|nr:hypothetical protein [Variovorax paradoxus]MBT2304712.1 hypothetical protein [Variovorax paradoxus]
MASIQVLRTSKFGLQPVLVEWEIRTRMNQVFLTAIVWPEAQQTGVGYELTARHTIRSIADAEDDDQTDDEFSQVARVAAHERAMLRAADLAAESVHVVDKVELEPLQTLTLRAWRSLGFYPGFRAFANQGGDVGELAREVAPIEFGDETNR